MHDQILTDWTTYLPGGQIVKGAKAVAGLIPIIIRRLPDAAVAAGDIIRSAV